MTTEFPLQIKQTKTYTAWSKPSGWTTHNEKPSLRDFIREKNPKSEVFFLNRLDLETSGIVIVCSNAETLTRLQSVWQSGSTRKLYVGLHRRPRDFSMREQTWDEPLTDKSEGRKNPRGLSKDRKPCLTRMIPVAETPFLFLSVLILETGRQHQIRKHAVLHGCELLGDTRYGDPRYLEKAKPHFKSLRLGLHAMKVVWTPDNSEEEILCPLPSFFADAIPQAQEKVQGLAL